MAKSMYLIFVTYMNNQIDAFHLIFWSKQQHLLWIHTFYL